MNLPSLSPQPEKNFITNYLLGLNDKKMVDFFITKAT